MYHSARPNSGVCPVGQHRKGSIKISTYSFAKTRLRCRVIVNPKYLDTWKKYFKTYFKTYRLWDMSRIHEHHTILTVMSKVEKWGNHLVGPLLKASKSSAESRVTNVGHGDTNESHLKFVTYQYVLVGVLVNLPVFSRILIYPCDIL